MKIEQDLFELLRKIQNNPNSSQRQLAKNLNFSLGKLNYCLKALKKKGLVKIDNFANNPNKLNMLVGSATERSLIHPKKGVCLISIETNKTL